MEFVLKRKNEKERKSPVLQAIYIRNASVVAHLDGFEILKLSVIDKIPKPFMPQKL